MGMTVGRTISMAAALMLLTAANDASLTGMWGAGDALLALDQDGGRLQTGCLLALIGPVHPDSRGHFSISAQTQQLSSQPPGEDEAPGAATQSATLTGIVTEGKANLILTIEGEAARHLSLDLGKSAKLARCL